MKAFNLRNVVVGLAGVAMLALAGCGSSFDCAAGSKCSADPAQPQASIDACNAAVAGTCGDQYKALGTCFQDAQTCTADNTTDPASLSGKCEAETKAYTDCVTGGSSSSGSTAGSGSGSGSGSTGA